MQPWDAHAGVYPTGYACDAMRAGGCAWRKALPVSVLRCSLGATDLQLLLLVTKHLHVLV